MRTTISFILHNNNSEALASRRDAGRDALELRHRMLNLDNNAHKLVSGSPNAAKFASIEIG
jgi:hypothetical protein